MRAWDRHSIWRRRTMKNLKHWTLLVLITLGLVEITAQVGLWALHATGRIEAPRSDELALTQEQKDLLANWIVTGGRYVGYSAELGWTIRPRGESGIYRANDMGVRADREYPERPPIGRARIATFGDSFTHGAEVELEATWQRRLEELSPTLEVINFGVDAYGLDQAYLRYIHDGRRVAASIVLIGFMSENINRQVSVFRPFYEPRTGMPFSKPRFELKRGDLQLLPNPLTEIGDYEELLAEPTKKLQALGAHDYFYRAQTDPPALVGLASVRLVQEVLRRLSGRTRLSPGFEHGAYDPSSEAYRVTERVLDRFYREVEASGSLPIVVVFPNRADLVRQSAGKPRSYEPLLEHLDGAGYRWIDLLEPLTALSPSTLFTEGGHYTPAGHRVVAGSVLEYLDSRELATPD